ncbi:MAG: thioredoxin [Ornithinimicrobium sp.]|uniref:thioredoxin n=1 Tax=Ornithinimicrobium sp. TaxID=1977084 RepID=UPI0026E07B9F|nr:thioredoxin [Ornithinimicrobium sp.]MDO5740503.1 thioredoxin [Ornithinimicrobium sp.]
MSTVNLTADSFEKAVSDNDIVLVDWWAEWCGPCKMFAPVYDQAAQKHSDVVFGKVDTEDQQALAAGAGITSIPTIMAFKEGVLVFRQPGALPARDLDSVITQIKALDMDDVRAKMAEEQDAAADA